MIELGGKRYYYCGAPDEEKGIFLDEIDEDDGYFDKVGEEVGEGDQLVENKEEVKFLNADGALEFLPRPD